MILRSLLTVLVSALASTLAVASPRSTDNAVIGLPFISCDEDAIRVQIETARPFRGKLFVKGEHARSDCVRDYSRGRPADYGPWDLIRLSTRAPPIAPPTRQSPSLANPWRKSEGGSGTGRNGANSNSAAGQVGGQPGADGFCPPCECADSLSRRKREAADDLSLLNIHVPLDKCNLQRDRIANPPGVRISFVVVVSFHENFITKLDRAYRVQCMYSESNRLVTTEFDVNMPNALNISGVIAPTSCEYRIRGKDGRQLTSVHVGDVVRHEWKCEAPDPAVYSLLVHSCTVEDGSGQRSMIIDERGCSTDPFVLPTPTYDSSLTASLEAFVFKFPDRAAVDFECSISLCVRGADVDCAAIMPPDCSPSSSVRGKRDSPSSTTSSPSLLASALLPTWTLHSERMYVVDPDENMDDVPSRERRNSALVQPSSLPIDVCLSIPAFGILVSFASCVATTAIIVLILLYRPKKVPGF